MFFLADSPGLCSCHTEVVGKEVYYAELEESNHQDLIGLRVCMYKHFTKKQDGFLPPQLLTHRMSLEKPVTEDKKLQERDSFSQVRDVFLSKECKNTRTEGCTALGVGIVFFVQGLAQGHLKRAAA